MWMDQSLGWKMQEGIERRLGQIGREGSCAVKIFGVSRGKSRGELLVPERYFARLI